MAYADWVVSSRAYPSGIAGAVAIDEGEPTGVLAPSGGLYLIHPTAALSMLDQLALVMTAGGVIGAQAYVTEQRHVRLVGSAPFDLTWASFAFRDLLGFTGDLTNASSYTAPNRSTLLWSPGKTFTPELAPLDAHGQPVVDASVTIGPQGRIVVRHHGSPSIVNTFTARHVERARFWAAPPAYKAGEWRHFWEHEAWTAQRMVVLRRVVEGSSTTASAGYSTSLALGPFRPDLTRLGRAFAFARDTGFESVEAYYPVSLPVVQTSEFA